MPCTRDADGKLDWTIPTNRSPGSKNWDGNAQRRAWWVTKAREVGIPIEGKWISQVAKAIHPWGWKPCQTCGRWMRLSYSYPTSRTVSVLNRWLPEDEQLEVSDYLDIYEVAEHLVETLGQIDAVKALASALPALDRISPADLAALQRELEERVVRTEPRGRLSPGAMSNAPDRLDGFHTYNLCCRAKQDAGRSLDNLKTYGVDRRAFEHWSEGDWEAANLLMSQTVEGTCPRCGVFGQLSADDIGPISLGFRHTPFFEAVCLSCNSAKSNRMSLQTSRCCSPWRGRASKSSAGTLLHFGMLPRQRLRMTLVPCGCRSCSTSISTSFCASCFERGQRASRMCSCNSFRLSMPRRGLSSLTLTAPHFGTDKSCVGHGRRRTRGARPQGWSGLRLKRWTNTAKGEA